MATGLWWRQYWGALLRLLHLNVTVPVVFFKMYQNIGELHNGAIFNKSTIRIRNNKIVMFNFKIQGVEPCFLILKYHSTACFGCFPDSARLAQMKDPLMDLCSSWFQVNEEINSHESGVLQGGGTWRPGQRNTGIENNYIWTEQNHVQYALLISCEGILIFMCLACWFVKTWIWLG